MLLPCLSGLNKGVICRKSDTGLCRTFSWWVSWGFAVDSLTRLASSATAADSITTMGLYSVLSVPEVLCLAVLVLRMSATWPKHISRKGRLWLTRSLVAVGVTSCLVLPFIPIGPPGYKTYMAGFRRYAQREVDLPAIRSWLSSLDPNDLQRIDADLHGKGGSESYGWRAGAWPPMITRLNPGYVALGKTTDGGPKIRLTWGGPFGHWGVEIGPEDMGIPLTRERKGQEFGPPDHRYTVYDTGEYRATFAPGAYIWHEIQ
jgi:hypothetical protein